MHLFIGASDRVHTILPWTLLAVAPCGLYTSGVLSRHDHQIGCVLASTISVACIPAIRLFRIWNFSLIFRADLNFFSLTEEWGHRLNNSYGPQFITTLPGCNLTGRVIFVPHNLLPLLPVHLGRVSIKKEMVHLGPAIFTFASIGIYQCGNVPLKKKKQCGNVTMWDHGNAIHYILQYSITVPFLRA